MGGGGKVSVMPEANLPDVTEAASLRRMLHELRQPMNVISLASGNMRRRLDRGQIVYMNGYLLGKLDGIDAQIRKFTQLCEVIECRFVGDTMAADPDTGAPDTGTLPSGNSDPCRG